MRERVFLGSEELHGGPAPFPGERPGAHRNSTRRSAGRGPRRRCSGGWQGALLLAAYLAGVAVLWWPGR
ncbi:MAG TPA: hypothetical protein VEH31_15115 [Streptosporangiaceae bacterium]|nr:hypothetical protein [Streptosporangiaceae bacterium]